MHARQMREAEGIKQCLPLFLEGTICFLNQPHTVERLVKIGYHLLEHLGLTSAEINPMAPLENRNDDLAIGLAHRWIDLEGAPKQAHMLRGLETSSRCSQALRGPGSEQCFRTAIDASCKRRSLESVGTMATKSRAPEWSSRCSQ